MKRLGDVLSLPARRPSLPAVAGQQSVAVPPAVERARTSVELEKAIMRALPVAVKCGLRECINFQTFEFVGFELINRIDPTATREVLGWLDAINRRPDQVEVLKEITRCLSVTAARAKDQTDLKMMLAVLAEELAEFPADVVRESLRDWSRTEKWWPTLSEIRERCLKATRMQRALRSILEVALIKAGPA